MENLIVDVKKGRLSVQNYIKKQIQQSYEINKMILDNQDILNLIQKVASKVIEVYKNGNKVLIAGNGGSAADAQHMAGEFINRFYFDRPGIPAIALTTDTSVLTAIANDYGFERLFARQVEVSGHKGDLFIAISTSGNSANIINAIKICNTMEIISVGLTGKTGGKMSELCDYCIKVPSNETPRIQEIHLMIEHILCAIVEQELFGEGF